MYTNPIPRLGIPSLCMADGPHGLRKQIGGGDNGVSRSEPATAFPTAVCTASGWNPENLWKMGAAIAEECRYYGVHTLLGPGVNIQRGPSAVVILSIFLKIPFSRACSARRRSKAFSRRASERASSILPSTTAKTIASWATPPRAKTPCGGSISNPLSIS
ncbi:MAG: hypothetical protein II650_04425 [Clostridia bacterium]|nr:hypothetical protein [Clostridia bacterium]